MKHPQQIAKQEQADFGPVQIMEDLRKFEEVMLDRLDYIQTRFPDSAREVSIAKTNLQQAVMWADLGVYK